MKEQTVMEKMRRNVAQTMRRVSSRKTALILCFALCALACDGTQTANNDNSDAAPATNANVRRNVKPEADSEVAVIETENYGTIVIELYPNLAPQMVNRFKQLINEGFYNGTRFHRIDPQLGIIQGGDPLSKDNDPTNDGTGNSNYPNVPAEFSDVPYERGIVGGARRGDSVDSANSQFYITLKRQPAFDAQYTVFGRVIEGFNNAEIISTAPVESGTERPADPIAIKRMTLRARGN